jgi:hypothetical protein
MQTSKIPSSRRVDWRRRMCNVVRRSEAWCCGAVGIPKLGSQTRLFPDPPNSYQPMSNRNGFPIYKLKFPACDSIHDCTTGETGSGSEDDFDVAAVFQIWSSSAWVSLFLLVVSSCQLRGAMTTARPVRFRCIGSIQAHIGMETAVALEEHPPRKGRKGTSLFSPIFTAYT